MRRLPSWIPRVAGIFAFLVVPVVATLLFFGGIVHGKYVHADIMREGHVIADAIHEHDPSVHVGWTTDDHGHPNIVIRDPLDTAKQDEIISWAKAAKAQGRVHRHIVIDFQKEIPHSSQPDIILREVEF
jgi:hypothetical protein